MGFLGGSFTVSLLENSHFRVGILKPAKASSTPVIFSSNISTFGLRYHSGCWEMMKTLPGQCGCYNNVPTTDTPFAGQVRVHLGKQCWLWVEVFDEILSEFGQASRRSCFWSTCGVLHPSATYIPTDVHQCMDVYHKCTCSPHASPICTYAGRI